jgi:ferredoxin
MFDGLKQAYLPRTRFPNRGIDRETCEKCLRCYEACPTYGFRVGEDGYPKGRIDGIVQRDHPPRSVGEVTGPAWAWPRLYFLLGNTL